MVQILEVPFVFRRSGYEPRARTETETTLTGKVPLKVAELRDQDAPVVVRCRYADMVPGIGEDGRPAWRHAELETDYRLVDGRLARRALPDSTFLCGGPDELPSGGRLPAVRAAVAAWGADPTRISPAHAQAAMEMIRLATSRGSPSVAPLMPGRRRERLYGARPEEDDGFSRREGDDRTWKAGQQTAALRGRLAFVDGELYVPSFGPGWLLQGGRAAGPGLIHVASRWSAPATPELAWASDDALCTAYMAGDEAACRRFAESTHGFDGFQGEIEILDPDAFRMHPDELAVRAEAREAVQEAATNAFLRRRDPEGLRAVADCMAMLDSDEPCADELRGAFSDFARRWDAGLPANSSLRWRSAGAARLEARVQAREDALRMDALPGPR